MMRFFYVLGGVTAGAVAVSFIGTNWWAFVGWALTSSLFLIREE
jgi:hypothetical protein